MNYVPPTPPPHRAISFVGITRDGVRVTGHTDVTDLAAWVHGQYRRGYQHLEVTDLDGDAVIGEVTRNPDGIRVWWSEEP